MVEDNNIIVLSLKVWFQYRVLFCCRHLNSWVQTPKSNGNLNGKNPLYTFLTQLSLRRVPMAIYINNFLLRIWTFHLILISIIPCMVHSIIVMKATIYILRWTIKSPSQVINFPPCQIRARRRFLRIWMRSPLIDNSILHYSPNYLSKFVWKLHFIPMVNIMMVDFWVIVYCNGRGWWFPSESVVIFLWKLPNDSSLWSMSLSSLQSTSSPFNPTLPSVLSITIMRMLSAYRIHYMFFLIFTSIPSRSISVIFTFIF